MGKKSKAQVKAVEKLNETCQMYLDRYIECVDNLKKYQKHYEDHVAQLEKIVTRLKGQHKTPAAFEQAIFNDPEYGHVWNLKSSADQLVKENTIGRGKAQNEIGNAITMIETQLDAFEKHVNKKAKSKNPFKNKKSITAARKFIGDQRIFLVPTKIFFKSIGEYVMV